MNKITIIGSGSVGSTIAYTLTVQGIASEIVMIDINEEKAKGEKYKAMLAQIEERQYEAALIAKGIPAEHIRKYGFAFEGKKVLIG